MASASPRSAPRRRGGGLNLGHAETSPRTLVGLQKVDVQLQKELQKLERQAQTAVSNIANHQQAMKMSWRRLEAQRNAPEASPGSRRAHAQKQASPALRKTLFSSNTQLYVGSSPEVYMGSKEDENTTRAQHQVTEIRGRPRATTSHSLQRRSDKDPLHSSPFLSSPHMYRRSAKSGHSQSSLLASSLTVPHSSSSSFPPPTTSSNHTASSSSSPPKSASTTASGSSDIRLPMIASASQPSLVATTNKDTLLKLSAMMGVNSTSHSPDMFKSVYTHHPTTHSSSSSQPLPSTLFSSTPSLLPSQSTGEEEEEEGEGKEKEERGDKELSLAEMFEQIRHCRYIRHYRPDGSAVEDF